MAEYKLTYFNSKGIAEPIRFIFAYAGVEFEDVRVEHENWPTVKPSFRWGQVPVLNFGDQQLAQSATIARFLAKKYDLVGENDLEAARADEIVDLLKDFGGEFRKVYMEQDPEKKKEIISNFLDAHIKPFLVKITALKEEVGGDWIVGKKVTWADFFLASAIDNWATTTGKDILADFPTMKAHQKAVFGIPKIKEWIEKHPA